MRTVVNFKPAEQPDAISEYKRFFPHFTPSPFQQDLIEQSITDLDRWRKTLTFWAGNAYRPQSILKMIDYYNQLGQPKRFEPGRDEGESTWQPMVCATCGSATCLDTHR